MHFWEFSSTTYHNRHSCSLCQVIKTIWLMQKFVIWENLSPIKVRSGHNVTRSHWKNIKEGDLETLQCPPVVQCSEVDCCDRWGETDRIRPCASKCQNHKVHAHRRLWFELLKKTNRKRLLWWTKNQSPVCQYKTMLTVSSLNGVVGVVAGSNCWYFVPWF